MLLDLIDLSKLRRAIVYGLLLAGILLVQNHIAARVPILGVRPLLIPAMVVAVGLFEDGMWGGMLGLAAGYFAGSEQYITRLGRCSRRRASLPARWANICSTRALCPTCSWRRWL